MLDVLDLELLAGLAEIGGGYLIWLYLRNGKRPLYFLLGGVILIIYGIIPTLQPASSFGKVYASYGGVFIALSILGVGSSMAFTPIPTTSSVASYH